MAMKNKDCFFITCLVIMLVLSGCSNVFNDTPEQDISIPDGFGVVRVSFAQGAARTVMPEVMLSSFHRIEYLFPETGRPQQR
jgi:hypothetical protein